MSVHIQFKQWLALLHIYCIILLHLLYEMNSFFLKVIYHDEIQCMFLVFVEAPTKFMTN